MPSKLRLLEVVLRRLAESDIDYPKYQEMFFKIRKGYIGETRSDREWKEISIPVEHYLFFNYETVNKFGNSNQIDTLLICRNFILILEVKNITGRIDFDEVNRQFINSKSDDKVEVYSNPEDQVERHIRTIREKVQAVNIRLPIVAAIIFSNTSTIIGRMPKRIPAFHLSGLHSFVTSLFNKYSSPSITSEEMGKLKDYLLDHLIRERWKPSINTKRIITGALCDRCKSQSCMVYSNGRFICSNCKAKSKDVLLESLHDYRLLYNPWISNHEFKKFFSISSTKTSYKLLKSLHLFSKGNTRSKIYYIPEDILDYKMG